MVSGNLSAEGVVSSLEKEFDIRVNRLLCIRNIEDLMPVLEDFATGSSLMIVSGELSSESVACIKSMLQPVLSFCDDFCGRAIGFHAFFGTTALAVLPQVSLMELLPSWLEDAVGALDVRETYMVHLIGMERLTALCSKYQEGGVRWSLRHQGEAIALSLFGADKIACSLFGQRISSLLGAELVIPGTRDALTILEDALLASGETICCAESCTGGLCAKLLTDRPGSSAYFIGGAATYALQAKMTMLGVKAKTLAVYTAVSSQTAREMAQGVRAVLKTDWAFATTGIAGPGGGSEKDPVGTVWFGFASEKYTPQAVCLHFLDEGRAGIRQKAAMAAMVLAGCYRKGKSLLDIASRWQYI
jgi:PncC family amidohydrolase